jgi:hypothetical protein
MSRVGVTYRPLRDPTPRFRLAAVWRNDADPLLKSFLATRPWSTPVDKSRLRHLIPAV